MGGGSDSKELHVDWASSNSPITLTRSSLVARGRQEAARISSTVLACFRPAFRFKAKGKCRKWCQEMDSNQNTFSYMTPNDPYLIPGTERPEPTQAAEHPTVERRSLVALIAAVAAILVASIAALFSGLQWRAADRQADIASQALNLAKTESQLTDKIVKGGNAAFFEPTFAMSPSEGYVDISFQNTGKVLAANFSTSLVVARKSIPEYKQLGESEIARIERSQIPPTKPSVGQTVALKNYSSDDAARIHHMQEIISVEGSFQYDNGFGDLIKQSLCLWYVDLRNPHGGGSSGFMPCEDARSAIALTRKR